MKKKVKNEPFPITYRRYDPRRPRRNLKLQGRRRRQPSQRPLPDTTDRILRHSDSIGPSNPQRSTAPSGAGTPGLLCSFSLSSTHGLPFECLAPTFSHPSMQYMDPNLKTTNFRISNSTRRAGTVGSWKNCFLAPPFPKPYAQTDSGDTVRQQLTIHPCIHPSIHPPDSQNDESPQIKRTTTNLHCQELEELLRHAPLVHALLPLENNLQLLPQAGVGYLGHLYETRK